MYRTILDELRPTTRAARTLTATAMLWAASTVVHLGVFAVDGGGWSGPVSWRKPIVFSASMALLLWAVGWVIDRMPVHRPRLTGVLAWTLAVAATVETGLIVVQTWRGRPSHFNVFTATDSLVFTVMGAMVMLMSVVLVALLVWTLVEPPVDRATRWAVVGGLAAIVLGLGIGQWLISLGVAYAVRVGAVPEVVMHGDAVAKFPHAVALHGIQVFAVVGALGRASGADARRRTSAMRAAVAGYAGLLAAATAHTVAGRAAADPHPATVVLVAVSVAALAWACVVAVRASDPSGHRSTVRLRA